MSTPLKTDLARYATPDFDRGSGRLRELLWMLVSALFFRHSIAVWSGGKVSLLRLFGATIGAGVIIKPSVNIKFPWKLEVGNYSWIGEGCWIDNLASVRVGNNCCLSQGSYLLTGNHNYKSSSFDLMTDPIVLEDGCWVGAKAIVGPGVRAGSHSILAVGSVASTDLAPYCIYRGNPAVLIRRRKISHP